MKERSKCKDCKKELQTSKYHKPSGRCYPCRNKHELERKERLRGEELAVDLLLSSCQKVLERVRSEEKAAYRGVKCSWSIPNKMKTDLMANSVFWEAWKKQSSLYERMGKLVSYRPTIDRIESRVEKNGHYYPENITTLSYSENAAKAKAVKCLVIFIKGIRIVRVTDYESINKVMQDLEITARNVRNIKRDSGKISEIGNGYSVLIQTVGGTLNKSNTPLYKMVVEKKYIIVDYKTGKEYVWKRQQASYSIYGIWFNNTSMMIR